MRSGITKVASKLVRVNAGLTLGEAKGAQLGRPRAMTDAQIAIARSLKAAGEPSSGKIADHLGVSRATLYRTLSE
jgi:DNA invertase Pin-like site-specific DNA recombinase